MKFRSLTNEELHALEDDLKAFLIVNGIDGPEWEKINRSDPQKAMRLVELFSDTVLEKAYSNIHYLEFRSPSTCIVFNCREQETELISLQLSETSPADLSTPESIHQALLHNAGDIQYINQSRAHTKSRAEEVHQLIEQGCTPSVKEFWISLKTVTEQQE